MMKAIIMVTSHTCVLAAQSAMPCLSRAFLILCASTHRTPPRDCAGGRRQQPEPDRFDWHVSFASEWLSWVGCCCARRRSVVALSFDSVHDPGGYGSSCVCLSADMWAPAKRERQWDSGRFAPTLLLLRNRHAPNHGTGRYKTRRDPLPTTRPRGSFESRQEPQRWPPRSQ